MPSADIEDRVASLERDVARLLSQQNSSAETPWWQRIRGRFADDADYVEAMRLGREWRSGQAKNDDLDTEV